MRFVFNFIVFGLIFYLIWLYQPDLFQVLVSIAARCVAFAQSFIQRVIEGVDTEQAAKAVSYYSLAT